MHTDVTLICGSEIRILCNETTLNHKDDRNTNVRTVENEDEYIVLIEWRLITPPTYLSAPFGNHNMGKTS